MDIPEDVLERLLVDAFMEGVIDAGINGGDEYKEMKVFAQEDAKTTIRHLKEREVSDGWGSIEEKCSALDCTLHVVRPGKFDCSVPREECPNYEP